MVGLWLTAEECQLPAGRGVARVEVRTGRAHCVAEAPRLTAVQIEFIDAPAPFRVAGRISAKRQTWRIRGPIDQGGETRGAVGDLLRLTQHQVLQDHRTLSATKLDVGQPLAVRVDGRPMLGYTQLSRNRKLGSVD